jgi:hypothetical protein
LWAVTGTDRFERGGVEMTTDNERDELVDADGFIDFSKLAPDWVDGTNPDNFTPEEIERIKNAPDRAAEIEAALKEKAEKLPIDTSALGY